MLEWRLKFLVINSVIEINNLLFCNETDVFVPGGSRCSGIVDIDHDHVSELLHHNSDFALGQTSNVVILSASSAISLRAKDNPGSSIVLGKYSAVLTRYLLLRIVHLKQKGTFIFSVP
jgi:hypothetical protein